MITLERFKADNLQEKSTVNTAVKRKIMGVEGEVRVSAKVGA